ncbi:hypothetical protein [Radiobacillus deserti]|uniref:Uncharacterized protein n=1 Tax=Radiobacillus deserti TaxID=2594883 RepID=A0A516KGS2_9BACI|nr:hypothetical protein [Radiobacillus deserti]QDP40591.1 hypothetical protein FN924_10555 [Radiobacillus deserti]
MDTSWYFVIASAVAVYGILFFYRGLIRQVQGAIEDGKELTIDSIKDFQASFFVKVAIIEVIPIILIVLGFIHAPVEGNSLIPVILIGAFYVSAWIQIFMLRQETIQLQNEQSPNPVIQTLTMLGISLTGSIPLISIIAIYTI